LVFFLKREKGMSRVVVFIKERAKAKKNRIEVSFRTQKKKRRRI